MFVAPKTFVPNSKKWVCQPRESCRCQKSAQRCCPVSKRKVLCVWKSRSFRRNCVRPSFGDIRCRIRSGVGSTKSSPLKSFCWKVPISKLSILETSGRRWNWERHPRKNFWKRSGITGKFPEVSSKFPETPNICGRWFSDPWRRSCGGRWSAGKSDSCRRSYFRNWKLYPEVPVSAVSEISFVPFFFGSWTSKSWGRTLGVS